MTVKGCKSCRYCAPASNANAKFYVRCLAPIELPLLPTATGQRSIFIAALEQATREPSNWTTIAHVNGEIPVGPGTDGVPKVPPAGCDCPLFVAK